MHVDDGPASEPAEVARPPAETLENARRSDRWVAGTKDRGNAWAWISVTFALVGVVAVAAIAAATAGLAPFDELPDRTVYVAFGSIPSVGILALVLGLTGRHGSRFRWVAWIGATLGAVLVLGAIAVTVILVTALRTLG